MELGGALSNPACFERLNRLNLKRRDLLRSPLPTKASPSPLKQGAVLNAVVELLAERSQPMRVMDIHAEVEGLLGSAIPKGTVKACLSNHARGEAPRFRRLGRGVYELR